MAEADIGECECDDCLQPSTHPGKELHRRMKLFLNRLSEQQKRWYVAIESEKIGRGGDKLMCQISGIHVETIRRGRRELASSLEGRPSECDYKAVVGHWLKKRPSDREHLDGAGGG